MALDKDILYVKDKNSLKDEADELAHLIYEIYKEAKLSVTTSKTREDEANYDISTS